MKIFLFWDRGGAFAATRLSELDETLMRGLMNLITSLARWVPASFVLVEALGGGACDDMSHLLENEFEALLCWRADGPQGQREVREEWLKRRWLRREIKLGEMKEEVARRLLRSGEGLLFDQVEYIEGEKILRCQSIYQRLNRCLTQFFLTWYEKEIEKLYYFFIF